MKTKNLSKLIGSAESTVVEWKQSLSEMDEIIETAAAFANTEGGRIFIGASKNGEVIHTVAHRELRNLLVQGIVVTKGAGKYLRYELTQG